MPDPNFKAIIQRMIDAGESEENIATVIRAQKSAGSSGPRPISPDEPSDYWGGVRRSVGDTVSRTGSAVLSGLNPLNMFRSLDEVREDLAQRAKTGDMSIHHKPLRQTLSDIGESLSTPEGGGAAIGGLLMGPLVGGTLRTIPRIVPSPGALRAVGTVAGDIDLLRPGKIVQRGLNTLADKVEATLTAEGSPNARFTPAPDPTGQMTPRVSPGESLPGFPRTQSTIVESAIRSKPPLPPGESSPGFPRSVILDPTVESGYTPVASGSSTPGFPIFTHAPDSFSPIPMRVQPGESLSGFPRFVPAPDPTGTIPVNVLPGQSLSGFPRFTPAPDPLPPVTGPAPTSKMTPRVVGKAPTLEESLTEALRSTPTEVERSITLPKPSGADITSPGGPYVSREPIGRPGAKRGTVGKYGGYTSGNPSQAPITEPTLAGRNSPITSDVLETLPQSTVQDEMLRQEIKARLDQLPTERVLKPYKGHGPMSPTPGASESDLIRAGANPRLKILKMTPSAAARIEALRAEARAGHITSAELKKAVDAMLENERE